MMNRVEMNENMMEQVVGGEHTREEIIQKANEIAKQIRAQYGLETE